MSLSPEQLRRHSLVADRNLSSQLKLSFNDLIRQAYTRHPARQILDI
jgi:hypothetical protein